MAAGMVIVKGLPELNAALGRLNRKVKTEMVKELRGLVEPVRVGAERNAVAGIRNIGGRWSGMRVGAASRVVYVAPRARRRGGSPRPNLAPLLLDQMQSALDEGSELIVAGVDHWLGELGSEEGF